METRFPPLLKYSMLKRFTFGLLAAYAVTVSVLLVVNRPQFVILLQDESGTRQISDERQIEKREQFDLIKRYLPFAYRYSAATYGTRIETAKKLMVAVLRDAKKDEFERISAKLKGLALFQCYDPTPGKIDIRFVDGSAWEVDLEMHVIEGLKERIVPLRVEITLARRERTIDNWSAWEVKSYAETQGQEASRTTVEPGVCGDRNLPDYAQSVSQGGNS